MNASDAIVVPVGKREAQRARLREEAALDMESRADRGNRILLAKLRERMPHWNGLASAPAEQPRDRAMSYEPRGKMINLVAAIQAEPERLFKAPEVAEILCCKNFPSTINQYVYASVVAGVIHKRQASNEWYYKGSPITDEDFDKAGVARPANWSSGARSIASPAYSPEEVAAARADVRAPKTDPTWKPPQMTPPRGTSAPVVQVHRETAGDAGGAGAAPAPIATRPPAPSVAPAPPPARLEAALDFVPAPFLAAPERAPAPSMVDASMTEGDGGQVDEQDELAEEAETDAYVSCRTGEIVIVGIEPDEDGRVTIPSDLVALIKRQIAWSPAA
jgi:hypothetical protein